MTGVESLDWVFVSFCGEDFGGAENLNAQEKAEGLGGPSAFRWWWFVFSTCWKSLALGLRGVVGAATKSLLRLLVSAVHTGQLCRERTAPRSVAVRGRVTWWLEADPNAEFDRARRVDL